MKLKTAALLTVAAAAAWAGGCPATNAPPGDTDLGSFAFEAKQLATGTCQFPDGSTEIPPFTRTLSLDSKTSELFLSDPGGTSLHKGKLEGDRFTLESSATRDLPPPCGTAEQPTPAAIVERLEGRLIGEAAARALGACPADPDQLDAILAALPAPDAGVDVDAGLRVRMVCGRIVEELTPQDGLPRLCVYPADAGSFPLPCTIVYSLSGTTE